MLDSGILSVSQSINHHSQDDRSALPRPDLELTATSSVKLRLSLYFQIQT